MRGPHEAPPAVPAGGTAWGGQAVSSKGLTSQTSAPSSERSTTQRPLRLTSAVALEFTSCSLLHLSCRLDLTALVSGLSPASSLASQPSLHTDATVT